MPLQLVVRIAILKQSTLPPAHTIMRKLTRITMDPLVMGGKPFIRGMRVMVGMVVGLVASGYSNTQILETYPYLETEDIQQALTMQHGALKK